MTIRNLPFQSPCTQDCPKRKGGCQVGCEEWAKYVALRDEHYAKQGELRSRYTFTPSQERRYRRALRKGKKGGRYGDP